MVEGSYSKYGTAIQLAAAGEQLMASVGPVAQQLLIFSNASMVLHGRCSEVARTVLELAPAWESGEVRRRLTGGECTLLQYILHPEIPAAGVSAKNQTIAFPWGCGNYMPMPDGASIGVLAQDGKGTLVLWAGAVLWA
eukprot:TRINITY_DN3865_c0_g1_i1.p1 TRINITY_DN3865_c0_g1~~TRINITY_DN3865_c0_g1_i1.p1  ORF type:complete len:138 (-),score=29.34 TRINITY_DN3865_c0_g1_i1:292-705(-)